MRISILKGVLNLVYMAVTVTHLVQHTVQTTHVYYTMEPDYHVNLAGERALMGGMEKIVNKDVLGTVNAILSVIT